MNGQREVFENSLDKLDVINYNNFVDMKNISITLL